MGGKLCEAGDCPVPCSFTVYWHRSFGRMLFCPAILRCTGISAQWPLVILTAVL